MSVKQSRFDLLLGRSQVRAATRTARCPHRDGGQAMRTVLHRRIFAANPVYTLDEEKDHKRDDHEIDDIVDESAIGDYWNALGLGVCERGGITL